MFKISLKKLTICITSIAALSTIAMTVGSCSGVSKTISNNMVSNNSDGVFASGAADANLATQVQLALNNKTSSAAFTKRIAGEVLYSWYKEHSEIHKGADGKDIPATDGFYNNWTRWNDDANKDYDDKIDSYKSQHKSDWPYYFQNEVMDPIGATTKADYVKNSVISSVRGEFDNLVFNKSYLGICKDDAHKIDTSSADLTKTNFKYYNPDMPVEKFNSTGNIDSVKKAPYRWQDIDFYAQTDSSYKPDNLANLSWQYAYMQHYAFQQMLQEQKPVLTSMVLWKYTDGGDGTTFKFSDMYNPKVVGSEDQKIGYQFPYFQDAAPGHINKGPNYEFTKFANDGFGTTPTFFFDTKAVDSANKNTGLISIQAGQRTGDVPYTDDSATLFKTNLGTDDYTSSYTNYAGTANALWNSATAANDTQKIYNDNYYKPTATFGKISDLPQTAGGFNNPTDILKNFLYEDNGTLSAGTDNKLPTGWNSSAAFLGTKQDGTPVDNTVAAANNLKGLVVPNPSSAGKYCADIFYNQDKTDEKQNEYYKNGYLWSVPAFQLGAPAAAGTAFKDSLVYADNQVFKTSLPFVAIRDDGQDTSGVHVIGLDGSVYLTVPSVEYATSASDVFTTLGHGLTYPTNSFLKNGTAVSKGKLDEFSSQDRENDIIKVRGLQAHVDGMKKEGAGNLDFAADSNNEIKTYWTANEDRLILEIAEKQGDYGDGSATGRGDGIATGAISTLKTNDTDSGVPKGNIFEIGDSSFYNQTLFDQLFNIVELISLRSIVQTAITNFADSNKKIMDLYKAQRTNADEELSTTDSMNDPTRLLPYLFKNGLTSPYPYSLSYNYSSSTVTPYKMDSTVIKSLQNIANPASGTQDDFFHGTQSLLINAAQQFYLFQGYANTADIANVDMSLINTRVNYEIAAYANTLKQNRVTTGNNQYSEHIIVDFNKNPEANELLNNFGSDANFVNNITLQAYDKYLKNGDNSAYVSANGTFNSDMQFTDSDGSGLVTGSDVNDALKSQYYATSVLGTDGTYSNYNHTSGASSAASIATFGNEMLDQWTKKNVSLDSSWGSTGTDNLSLGSSSTRIDYYKMMASLKYLTSNTSGKSSYINFAKWLNNKISYGTPYYLAWTSKDWDTYKADTDPFVTKTANWSDPITSANDIKNYEWKNDYANENDITLTGKVDAADIASGKLSNGSRTTAGKTYVTNSNYYKYAAPKNNANVPLMGYKGLVSGSGDIDGDAGDLLINHFNNANPFTPQARDLAIKSGVTPDTNYSLLYSGALAQYGELGDWYDCSKDGLDVRPNTLTGTIYNARGANGAGQLHDLITKLQTLLPSDSFQNVLNNLDNHKSIWDDKYSSDGEAGNKSTAQALINILTNAGPSNPAATDSTWNYGDKILHWNDVSEEMNFKLDYDGKEMVLANPVATTQTQMTNVFLPITAPIEAVNFKDETAPSDWKYSSLFKSDDGASRVLFSQVTSSMLNPDGYSNTGLTDEQADEIVGNAVNRLGASVFANLLVQAAQDTGTQTSASKDVLNAFQTSGYVIVHDRRFNDLLGASWVKDYKDKN